MGKDYGGVFRKIGNNDLELGKRSDNLFGVGALMVSGGLALLAISKFIDGKLLTRDEIAIITSEDEDGKTLRFFNKNGQTSIDPYLDPLEDEEDDSKD